MAREFGEEVHYGVTKLVSVNEAGLPVENPCYSSVLYGPAVLALLKSLLEIWNHRPHPDSIRIWALIRSLDGTRAVVLNPNCK